MVGISKKLRLLIGDLSVNGWANDHGLPPQTVHEWLKHDRMPRLAALKLLAQSTNSSIEWWKYGKGNPPISSQPYTTRPVTPIISGSGIHNGLVADDSPLAGEGAFVSIDNYVNVRGSAGPGTEVSEEAIVKVRVDARLLRERIGANFNCIKIAGVSGDSMEPTLSHGDQVLVDTSCNRFIDDAIYAIQQDGHLRFKRIKLNLDGSIVVKSDATIDVETYPAELAQNFKIIGMIIPFKFGRFKV